MRIVLLESLGVSESMISDFANSLKKDGHSFSYIENAYDNIEMHLNEIEKADVLMVANTKLPLEVLKLAKNLRYISVAFTGVDHIPVSFCKENGIKISNCSGYSDDSVSELTFGLLLNIARNIKSCDTALRTGKTKDGLIGFEIKGKTMGIVGLGKIGISVAKKALAFGMDVIAYSRTQKEEATNLGIKYVGLEQLMSKSDVVSLHLPYNEETDCIINEHMLSLMKKGSVIINTARGKLIDNLQLAKLVENNVLLAGIDVYETEPPIDKNHPLISTKNSLLTPHIAFATNESMIKRAHMTFENVKSFLSGDIIRPI